VKDGLPLIDLWDLGPELLSTLTAPITHVERYDLASCCMHRRQEPLLVCLLPDEAPRLIGLGIQPPNDHICRTGWELDVQVVGASRKALDHELQEPRETDAHIATEPA
jgi:hypothetical protein